MFTTSTGDLTSEAQCAEPSDPYGYESLIGYGGGCVAAALFVVLAVGIQETGGEISRHAFKGADAFSTLAFALAGTYTAANHLHFARDRTTRNFIYCLIGGLMTGVGGGVIRDLLTQSPIMLLRDITLSAAGAMGGLIGVAFAQSPNRAVAAAISWMDSIAVAVAIVVGTKKGLALHPGMSSGAAVCCAMICATCTTAGGGFLRDLLIMRAPSALRTLALFLPSAGAIVLVLVPQWLGRPEISRHSIEVWVAIFVMAVLNEVLSRYQFRKPQD